jgi:hypothetical protein
LAMTDVTQIAIVLAIVAVTGVLTSPSTRS